MKMVKCPHCGSTAQVKSNGNPIISKRGFLAENFSCGCGCNWEINNDRNKKGYWQVSHIETMMKETINKLKGHIHCTCNGYDCCRRMGSTDASGKKESVILCQRKTKKTQKVKS